MTDIRTLLADVSQDQPPCGITRDAAIRAGRRARRRQTVAGAGCAVAAAAVLGAATLPFYLSSGVPQQVAAPPAAASPSVSAPAALTPKQITDKLTIVLLAAATHISPGTQFVADPYRRPNLRPDAFQVTAPVPGTQTGAWYEGYAVAVDAQGRGTVYVMVAQSAAAAGFGEEPCVAYTTSASSCAPRTGPHGERLAVWKSTKANGEVEMSVTLYRADGSAVCAGTSNYTEQPGSAAVTRPTPSLTVDQLIALATEPGLVLS